MMNQDEKELLLQKFTEVNHRLMVANEQLEKANRKLKEYEEMAAKAEKASRMKTLFLANMSHEIRTPLNAIEGFSRIMAETDSPEERQNFMEIIESNNSRLLSLINEILDLSRVESGEIVLKSAPTDLSYLMKFVYTLGSFSGRPYFSLPKAMLFIRNVMFFARVLTICIPSPSSAASPLAPP
jgi:signal transduction histidine kinase